MVDFLTPRKGTIGRFVLLMFFSTPCSTTDHKIMSKTNFPTVPIFGIKDDQSYRTFDMIYIILYVQLPTLLVTANIVCTKINLARATSTQELKENSAENT